MAATFTLTRVNTTTGKVLTVPDLTQWEAEQRVAWCATDNLGWTRKAASVTARTLGTDLPLILDTYTFTLERN